MDNEWKQSDPIIAENLELFKKDLKEIINKNGVDVLSNTPDFILSEYLYNSFINFSKSANNKSQWDMKIAGEPKCQFCNKNDVVDEKKVCIDCYKKYYNHAQCSGCHQFYNLTEGLCPTCNPKKDNECRFCSKVLDENEKEFCNSCQKTYENFIQCCQCGRVYNRNNKKCPDCFSKKDIKDQILDKVKEPVGIRIKRGPYPVRSEKESGIKIRRGPHPYDKGAEDRP
ncbi:MAG: hypothetical protein AABY32_00790 [Nanoarchaeota archaeon]